jgi:uncharacterized OsmC-like protein
VASTNNASSSGSRTADRTSDVGRRQAALRAHYANSPSDALTHKSARTSAAGAAASDPFHGEVEVGQGYGTSIRFGLDRTVGGLHDAPNPGDLLCAALAACEDGTIRMVANLLHVELTRLEVEVTGDLDVRGCLGAHPDVRVGFEALDCTVRITAAEGTDPKRLEALAAAAERFCVNLDTLRGGIEVPMRTDISAG